MTLDLTRNEALWFLPLVLPVCLWVMYSDISTMKIPNKANLTLFGIFVLVGLIVVPLWPDYPFRLLAMVIMLVAGIAANAAGLMGAGDAKFIAAAAPFVLPADALNVLLILTGALIVSYTAHSIAKNSRLRNLAPDWESWHSGRRFPMGLALGATLIIYLSLGVYQGA